MIALLERVAAPPSPPSPAETAPPDALATGAPDAVTLRVCSGCYLSEAELNRTGLLGCSRCYETFAPLIASAVGVLHGVHVPADWAMPKPRRSVTNPWPTRRGVRVGG